MIEFLHGFCWGRNFLSSNDPQEFKKDSYYKYPSTPLRGTCTNHMHVLGRSWMYTGTYFT